MISFILTYRSGGIHREKNLQYCLRWIDRLPVKKEILIVEQDSEFKLTQPLIDSACRLVNAYNPGLFNRSWGFNVGARLACYDWFVFTDSDLVLSNNLMLSAFDALSTTDAINPYRSVLDLNAETTQELVRGERNMDLLVASDGSYREGLNFSGGMLLIKRTAFEMIGGWPEYIRGWGREDNILSEQIASKLSHQTLPGTAYHLFHPAEGLITHRYSELNTWFLEHPDQRPSGAIGSINKHRGLYGLREWLRDLPYGRIISSYYHYQMITHARNRQTGRFLVSLCRALSYHPLSAAIWKTCLRYLSGKVAT
ncbi:MAG TPA: galactosyltransferase-related protein [Cyclobacteriaceae bacterium]|nr:galactosyltransferase-related protein [Cyclobacteriaceae bacterium]